MQPVHLDEYQTRLQKRSHLLAANIPPYANKFLKTHTTQQLHHAATNYNLPQAEMLMENGAENTYAVAGRVMMFRTHGKLSFVTLQDDQGTIQLAFVKDLCVLNTWSDLKTTVTLDGQELSAYKFVEKYIDVADFIWAKGELFITKHGELTLFVNEFQLLTKTLKPLGDKWHGIQDEEMIYRQRYLDMTMNNESFQRMILRSTFIKTLREFYRKHNFIELDTPILGNSASGAAATPFVTRHEDFWTDMYLRIAPEIALKIATAGGMERVFEIGKDFRNEGSSPSHHQEFLVAEHYAAYWNFEDNIRFTEAMFEYLFAQMPQLQKRVLVADKEGVEREVDFSTPRQRIDYIDQIKKDSGIDVWMYTADDEQQLRELIQEKWFTRQGIENQTTATMIDYLYKKVTRPKIVGPAFITNYPKTMQPLARQSDANPNIVEQFQVIVNGWEILKAYSELVDPIVQAENFAEQAAAATAGDSEATRSDDEFLTAMEHGMPPQSWWGMWIDRILAMLTRQKNIRDVIMFPMMKPENGHQDSWDQGSTQNSSVHNERARSEGEDIYWQVLWEVHIDQAQDAFWFTWGEHESYKVRKATRVVALDEKGCVALVTDHKHGFTQLPGWGRERGEDIISAVKREAKEEAGVEITNIEPLGIITEFRSIYTKLYQKNFWFVAQVDGEKWLPEWDAEELEKGYTLEWCTLEHALQKLTQQLQELLDKSDPEEVEQAIMLIQKRDIRFLQEAQKKLWLSLSDTGPSKSTSSALGDLPSEHDALGLIDTYLTDTKRHCVQVGEIMRAFAKELGEDEHYRWLAGVLHDIDRDYINKDASKHLKDEFDRIMDQLNAPQPLRDDIKSHGERLTGVPVDSVIRKYLASVDELSGFLYAYSLLRPTWFAGMEVKSVKKRLKDKTFAAGIDRTHVMNCETYLQLPFDEFCAKVITMMWKEE